jgi:hypothetical protein
MPQSAPIHPLCRKVHTCGEYIMARRAYGAGTFAQEQGLKDTFSGFSVVP